MRRPSGSRPGSTRATRAEPVLGRGRGCPEDDFVPARVGDVSDVHFGRVHLPNFAGGYPGPVQPGPTCRGCGSGEVAYTAVYVATPSQAPERVPFCRECAEMSEDAGLLSAGSARRTK